MVNYSTLFKWLAILIAFVVVVSLYNISARKQTEREVVDKLMKIKGKAAKNYTSLTVEDIVWYVKRVAFPEEVIRDAIVGYDQDKKERYILPIRYGETPPGKITIYCGLDITDPFEAEFFEGEVVLDINPRKMQDCRTFMREYRQQKGFTVISLKTESFKTPLIRK